MPYRKPRLAEASKDSVFLFQQDYKPRHSY